MAITLGRLVTFGNCQQGLMIKINVAFEREFRRHYSCAEQHELRFVLRFSFYYSCAERHDLRFAIRFSFFFLFIIFCVTILHLILGHTVTPLTPTHITLILTFKFLIYKAKMNRWFPCGSLLYKSN